MKGVMGTAGLETNIGRETCRGYSLCKAQAGLLARPANTSRRAALLRCFLTLTEPVGLSAPKFPNIDVSRTQVRRAGSSFPLLCEAQGHPTPAFR